MLTDYVGMGKDFVYKTSKAHRMNQKQNEFVYIRIKEFCVLKGHHDRIGEDVYKI